MTMNTDTKECIIGMNMNTKMIMISAICSMTLAVSLFSTSIFADPAPASSSVRPEQPLNAKIATASFTERDLDLLSRDMTGLPLDGDSYNGGVAAIGQNAFAVAASPKSTPIMAAARYGQGRVVTVGSESYFNLSEPAQPNGKATIARNILLWATEGLATSYQDALAGKGRIALLTKTEDFKARSDLPVDITRIDSWRAADKSGKPMLDPGKFPVAFIDYKFVSKDEVPALLDYIHKGGRLVVALKGWVLEQFPNVSLDTAQSSASLGTDYPLQQLLNSAGLSLMNNQATTWDGTAPFLNANQAAAYEIGNLISEAKWIEAGTKTIDQVRIGFPDSNAKQKMAILTSTLSSTLGALTPSSPIYDQVQSDSDQFTHVALPVDPQKKPYSASLLPVVMDRIYQNPSGTKSPFADAFPGKVPVEAPVINDKVVEVDFDYSTYAYLRQGTVPKNWISTGLYAEAGKTITVTVPGETPDLDVQIGVHTDNLKGLPIDKWSRAPLVTTRMSLKPGANTITSPYGGLVYLIPAKPQSGKKAAVHLSGAVNAPYYVLGTTDKEEWKNTVRNYSAPWAELQSRRVIITVPSEYVRNLDNPEEFLKLWDVMLDQYDKLAGVAPNKPEPHRSVTLPYRYAGDAQISAGFMHAGYPIMFFNDPSAVDAVTVNGIKTLDGWGWWHETGHEYQQYAWTWGAVGEATVNIYSLFIQDYFGNHSRLLTKKTSDGKTYYDVAFEYLNSSNPNKNFNNGDQNDVWTRLIMFRQLQIAYGWDLYTKLHTAVRDMPQAQLPQNDQERIDLFVAKTSELSGNNLLEFFDTWGLKYSDKAKAKVLGLKLPKPATAIWTLKDSLVPGGSEQN